jgi:hypothetical protein
MTRGCGHRVAAADQKTENPGRTSPFPTKRRPGLLFSAYFKDTKLAFNYVQTGQSFLRFRINGLENIFRKGA